MQLQSQIIDRNYLYSFSYNIGIDKEWLTKYQVQETKKNTPPYWNSAFFFLKISLY